ncbi:hypothetical protein Bbelb_094990 [Branchiostoma belcheri]|nr:hypothetical protein Bbelb_094990 [Branchiostoma belcheri]
MNSHRRFPCLSLPVSCVADTDYPAVHSQKAGTRTFRRSQLSRTDSKDADVPAVDCCWDRLAGCFYKVRTAGAMTNQNVRTTCEAAGMRFPCYGGNQTCFGWASDCISVNKYADDCRVPLDFFHTLCGPPYGRWCGPLGDMFVYLPDVFDDGGACGFSWCTSGAEEHDKFALCAVAVGNCASSFCSNGSTCLDLAYGHTCLCAPGFGGNFCETDLDECSSAPCHNGATCQDGVNSFTCQCAAGYTGPSCEIDIDECASTPCWARGTCVDRVNGYSCVCPKGFSGERCETVMYADGCLLFSSDAVSYPEASQECQTRGGHLVDVKEAELQRLIADSIPTGSDVSPWIGLKLSPGVMTYDDGTSVSDQLEWSVGEPTTSCELCAYLNSADGHRAKTASCTERHNYVCQSGGVVVRAIDYEPGRPGFDSESYMSVHAPRRCALGKGTLHDFPHSTQDNCPNSGVCSTCFNGTYTFCPCPVGYEGDPCDIEIDECSSEPCANGGICLDGLNSYRCFCQFGYTGDNCQTDLELCAMVSCPSDWQCQDEGNHFICIGDSTSYDPCSSASCPRNMYCKKEGPASFSCRVG